MCSVAGGMARWFIDREVPSRLIPFRGEFPLLDTIETKRFREAIRSTMWIEELPPKLRYAAAEGSRMARLEEDFRHYLSRYEVTGDDFETWDEAEKSRWLRDWMKAASVSEDDLTVKNTGKKRPRLRNPLAIRRYRTSRSGKLMTTGSRDGSIGTICAVSSDGSAGRRNCGTWPCIFTTVGIWRPF